MSTKELTKITHVPEALLAQNHVLRTQDGPTDAHHALSRPIQDEP